MVQRLSIAILVAALLLIGPAATARDFQPDQNNWGDMGQGGSGSCPAELTMTSDSGCTEIDCTLVPLRWTARAMTSAASTIPVALASRTAGERATAAFPAKRDHDENLRGDPSTALQRVFTGRNHHERRSGCVQVATRYALAPRSKSSIHTTRIIERTPRWGHAAGTPGRNPIHHTRARNSGS